MTIKYYIKKVDDLILPSKANFSDAGYDVIAISDPKIIGNKIVVEGTDLSYYSSIDYIEYETGLYFIPQGNYFYTDLRPRSSISSKTNLVLANSIGLIDSGYHDQVLVRFRYIWQPEDMWWGSNKIDSEHNMKTIFGKPNLEKMYKKGDKIAQLVPKQAMEIQFVIVDDLNKI